MSELPALSGSLPRAERRFARTVLATQPDHRLVSLVRAGSDSAFEEIIRRHRGPLLRYSRRLLGDARAEDAVQQALINAFRALPREQEELNLRAWLFQLTHHAAIDVLRRRRIDTVPLDASVEGVERPDQALLRREARVNALPGRQREALLLRAMAPTFPRSRLNKRPGRRDVWSRRASHPWTPDTTDRKGPPCFAQQDFCWPRCF